MQMYSEADVDTSILDEQKITIAITVVVFRK